MPHEPNEQVEALGAAIRAQRKLANLSLRQLAGIAEISNPYLSQIERGLHAPSVHVLRSIANALSLSAETLQEQAGVLGDEIWPRTAREASDDAAKRTELALRRDPSLTDEQKAALLAVYRSYRDANLRAGGSGATEREDANFRTSGSGATEGEDADPPPPSRRSTGHRAASGAGGRSRGGRSKSGPPRAKKTGS